VADTHATRLFDAIYGCLVGGAIGDAMGGVTEMMTYEHIARTFGWIDTLRPRGHTAQSARFEPGAPAGQVTDDTRLRNLLCSALIRAGGRITADEWAQTWLAEMEGWFYIPVVNAFYKVFLKIAPPREAGRGNMGSNSTAMAIAPVGLVNACDPRQAAWDAYNVAGLVHEGYARDAACAVAAAVAHAVAPNATITAVIDAACRFLPSGNDIGWRIARAMDLARASEGYEAFRRAFYDTMLLPWPQRGLVSGSRPPEGFYDTAEPRETVPAAFALLALADTAEGGRRVFYHSVIYAANFGRDADTLASIVGSIAGAYEGARAIPDEWIRTVEASNPVSQRALAEGLYTVVRREWAATRARLAALEQLVTPAP
jgi:ADP-ribosylglycohydrolase